MVGSLPVPPSTPLHSTQRDAGGTARLVSDNIRGIKAFKVGNSRFRRPDRYFTGYGADGYWYTDGDLDPSHTPFEASWAAEVAGPHRGASATFPDNILCVTTEEEFCILDARTLEVWMRFLTGGSLGTALGQDGWSALVVDFDFLDGIFVLGTPRGVVCFSFVRDRVYWTVPAGSVFWPDLALRNAPTFRGEFAYVEGEFTSFDTRGQFAPGGDRGLALAGIRHVRAFRAVHDYATDHYEPTFVLSTMHRFAVFRALTGSDEHPRILAAGLPPASTVALQSGYESRGEVYTNPDPTEPWLRYLHVAPPNGDVDLRDLAQVGDLFVQGILTSAWRITSVQETHLEISGVYAFGLAVADSYKLAHPTTAVPLPDRSLALLSATEFRYLPDPGWAVDPATAYSGSTARPWPTQAATEVRDAEVVGEWVMAATDGGVLGFQPADPVAGYHLYGSASSEARYPILPGNDVVALTFDEGTRTLTLAVKQGSYTTLVEIDPVAQKVVATSSVRGRVRSLSSTPREV
jgi:hypothetical protein